jgi:hypothetical protein
MRDMLIARLRAAIGGSAARQGWAMALAAGLATFATVYIIDAFLARINLHAEATILDDTLLAILVGALVLFLERKHQRELREQLHRIAVMEEMNHHVRNALQAIIFLTFNLKDKEATAKLRNATEKIEWALREVLPKKAGEKE